MQKLKSYAFHSAIVLWKQAGYYSVYIYVQSFGFGIYLRAVLTAIYTIRLSKYDIKHMVCSYILH